MKEANENTFVTMRVMTSKGEEGEVTAGTLILLGLFTRVGLTLSGLLLIGLTFGLIRLGDAPTVAHNLLYALINFVLLWLVDLNRYALDSLFRRRAPAGFTS